MEKSSRFLALFAIVFVWPFLTGWRPPVRLPEEAPKKVLFYCQSSGAFNIAHDGSSASFATWCVEGSTTRGGKPPVVVQVEDTVVMREESSKIPGQVFGAPFLGTKVSIEASRGKPVVKVHYPTGSDTESQTLQGLERRYVYTFSSLVPAPIEPLQTERWLEK